MVVKSFTKGFTLIELLVVIAIIGILASVVLGSLNSARDKGSDAAIRSSINNARAQAELYYDNNKNYTLVCTGAGGIANMLASADSTNGSGAAFCSDEPTTWMLKAQLTTGFYCVDNTGRAITSTTTWSASGTACP